VAFQTSEVSMTDVEAAVFTPTGTLDAFLVRNTGDETVYVGPAGGTIFPVESGELIVFSGITTTDVLKGKCDTGKTSTLVLIWRAA
jgi:hypothetical protein